MPNDSSTGGYLVPETPEPSYDRPLEDIIQGALVGITGVPGQLVRPRFQFPIPNQPDFDIDWIAFGVSVIKRDWDAHQIHDADHPDGGANEVRRDEELEVFLSFYGPNGSQIMARWIDGLALDQNRWALGEHGIKIVGSQDPVMLPALLKDRWVRRVDLKTNMIRRVLRVYPVRTVTGVDVALDNERYITNITVRQP